MSEISLQWMAFVNMLALSFASLAYGFGGMEGGRILRRFISPLILFGSIVVTATLLHKFSFLILVALPLLILRNCLGYGGNNGIPSWLQRTLIALLSILTGAVLGFSFEGGWLLLIPHAVVALSTIFWAFKNPIFARMEESLVCFCLNIFLLGYAFTP